MHGFPYSSIISLMKHYYNDTFNFEKCHYDQKSAENLYFCPRWISSKATMTLCKRAKSPQSLAAQELLNNKKKRKYCINTCVSIWSE